ncbi:MAG: sigma factor [Candidatus Limnocylindria bacterium]
MRPRCAPRPDRTYAEAAVHDAFVAVWKGIDRFDYRADDLSTWVMGFVRRHSGQ